jgi:hypothetical protein
MSTQRITSEAHPPTDPASAASGSRPQPVIADQPEPDPGLLPAARSPHDGGGRTSLFTLAPARHDEGGGPAPRPAPAPDPEPRPSPDPLPAPHPAPHPRHPEEVPTLLTRAAAHHEAEALLTRLAGKVDVHHAVAVDAQGVPVEARLHGDIASVNVGPERARVTASHDFRVVEAVVKSATVAGAVDGLYDAAAPALEAGGRLEQHRREFQHDHPDLSAAVAATAAAAVVVGANLAVRSGAYAHAAESIDQVADRLHARHPLDPQQTPRLEATTHDLVHERDLRLGVTPGFAVARTPTGTLVDDARLSVDASQVERVGSHAQLSNRAELHLDGILPLDRQGLHQVGLETSLHVSSRLSAAIPLAGGVVEPSLRAAVDLTTDTRAGDPGNLVKAVTQPISGVAAAASLQAGIGWKDHGFEAGASVEVRESIDRQGKTGTDVSASVGATFKF